MPRHFKRKTANAIPAPSSKAPATPIQPRSAFLGDGGCRLRAAEGGPECGLAAGSSSCRTVAAPQDGQCSARVGMIVPQTRQATVPAPGLKVAKGLAASEFWVRAACLPTRLGLDLRGRGRAAAGESGFREAA